MRISDWSSDVCSSDLMTSTLRIVAQTVFHHARNPSAGAVHVLQLAEIARYRGILALQPHVASLHGERMLHEGISMVVDGTSGEDIERILQRELQATVQRQTRSANVLRQAAETHPALGLHGTTGGPGK